MVRGSHTVAMKGAAFLEMLVVTPVLLLLGLGSVQLGLLYHAQLLVNYATLEAARTGATQHAQAEPMLETLALRLRPLLADKRRNIFAGNGILAGVNPAVLNYTRLQRLNPTAEAFADWASQSSAQNEPEIPNSHLIHRKYTHTPGAASGISLLDANILQIKVVHGVKMQVPIVSTLIAAAMSQLDRGNGDLYQQGRIPLAATVSVRMQSTARRRWETANYLDWTEVGEETDSVIDESLGDAGCEISEFLNVQLPAAIAPGIHHGGNCSSNNVTINTLFGLIDENSYINNVGC